MSFCPQCGQQVNDGLQFCPSCGTRQPQQTISPAAPSPTQYTAPPAQHANVSDMELRQLFAKMSGTQLLPWLHKAEAALNALLPAARQVAEAEVALDKKRKTPVSDASKKDDARIYATICGVVIGLLLLFQLVPAEGLFIGGLIALAQGVAWLIIAILAIVFIVNLVNYFKISASIAANGDTSAKQYAAEIAQLEAALAQANAAVEVILRQHSEGQRTRLLICPKEGRNDPQLLRMFISYIETGRANNLNEAISLYETYMHRMYMESRANAQLQAAQAAEAAANQAYAAASRAENEAAAAGTAARNAEYYSRWK